MIRTCKKNTVEKQPHILKCRISNSNCYEKKILF